jgi:hypothetical protein
MFLVLLGYFLLCCVRLGDVKLCYDTLCLPWLVYLGYVILSYINLGWVRLVSFRLNQVVLVRIRFNYVRQFFEREILTTGHFAMLVVGFLDSVLRC